MAKHIKNAQKNIYSSIDNVEEQEHYPMSSAQKRLYILDQFDNIGIAYNNPYLMLVEGHINRLRFEEVFQELIRRHETLRTSFAMVNGEPVQKIHDEVDFNIEYLESNEEEAEIIKGFVKPFDLDKAPLLRVNLIKIKDDKHLLLFDMHHIISDGTSLNILLKEFISLYQEIKLPDLRIQYKDYSAWQKKQHQEENLEKQEKYWLETFSNEIPVLNMPLDHPRPAVQSFEGDSLNFQINNELVEKLNSVAQDTGSTLYMILLAVFNTLLYKYSGQEDIVVGSPIAGRKHPDLEKLIGMFVNTLAMRNYPEGDKTFTEFLGDVKENALKAYENQDYQFEELVEKLDIKRDLSRNPIFDVMFILQNMDMTEMRMEGLKFTPYPNPFQISKFDLSLTATETKKGINFEWEYSTKLFVKETIQRLTKHYTHILEQATETPDIKLKDIDLLTEEEKNIIIHDFNNTTTEYPHNKTLQELFEEQVEQTPYNVAITYGNQQLTYQELNEKSNQLARVLRSKGIKPDSIVGLMVERSPEMIIAIMGVVKAGGAYMPIDPSYPEERIHYMLQDSDAEILLTQTKYSELELFKGETLDLQNPSLYTGGKLNLEKTNTPHNLLYIIYTSGSTGKPKGVMMEQQCLVNLLYHQYKSTNINFNSKVLQFASISFDVSHQEIFSTLLKGGELHLIQSQERNNIPQMLDYIEKNKTQVLFFPPTYLKYICSEKNYIEKLPKSANHIITSGDQLIIPIELKKYLKENNITLHNQYGPSETHVVSMYTIESNSTIPEIPPIGKPINNTQIYILNKNQIPQPIGIPGELCISGFGLARGYLNKPKLTDEVFVDNPFISDEKMYHTGDLARWLPDGNIEFLGRIDHQVKIRGYRIELGEIESQLLKHPSIKEVVVTSKEDLDGDSYLCAYYVGNEDLTIQKLRTYLSKFLPEYMIPAYFKKLENVPLTPNGKINRKALPEPDGSISTGVEYVAPQDIIEEKLILIWQDILGVKRIGTKDNFFELGGHSLKATKLVSQIHQEFNVDFPLRKVFQAPTIKEMAEYIKGARESIYSNIQPIDDQDYYPMSSAQKRQYILNQFDNVDIAYNMPGLLMVEGPINRLRFEKVFQELISRHETLRTSFAMVNGEPVQKIHKEVDFSINYLESTEEEAEEIIKGFVKPFDLNQAPLLRVNLIKIKENKHLLLFDIHHIISDATSMNILLQELINTYEKKSLPDLRIQYKDYSAWQEKQHTGDFIQKQEEYWLETFNDEIPVLNMPLDFPRPMMQSFEGDSINFQVNSELVEKLNNIAKDSGATLYMILLAAFNTLLSKYTGQEDIVVGSPILGRPHTDLENLIGMFVNTLAMRNYPEGDKTFRQFLKNVKENALNAYENQDYQFEELVEKLDIKRDLSRNPIFDVMFVLLNMDMSNMTTEELRFKAYEHPSIISKFDLTLYAMETPEGMTFNLEYCTQLFQKETIQRQTQQYIKILEEVATNPDLKLNDIDIITEEEKNTILFDFNNNPAEYPQEETIQEIFEEQVKRTPDNVALVYGNNQLTYQELNEKTNQLAHALRNKGVKPDDIIGLLVDRSPEMIIAILAVLKAGGAYLPIDPNYPEKRIQFILQDSATGILLTQPEYVSNEPFDGIILDLKKPDTYEGSPLNPNKVNASHNLAYMIYTSGSTGNPKGVMVNHGSLMNTLLAMQRHYPLLEDDAYLMKTAYTFDVSLTEIFGWIYNSGRLILLKEGEEKDPKRILEAIEKYGVTHINFVPSMLKTFTDTIKKENKSLNKLKYVFSAGEAITKNMADKFYEGSEGNLRLENLYGPTEGTIYTTRYSIKREKENINIPIGKPLDNTKAYILDRNSEIQPIGIPGELCIAGEGLARGYLNNPELTSELFVDNPFTPGERLYRTGDLARWLPDGNIEFLGRIDHQVKIRGYRIELGEIENQLINHPSIKETVTVANEDLGGDSYLCAYYVGDEELTTQKIRTHLSQSLPEYMIPTYFIKLDKIPLTPNGKIDRKILPEPDGSIRTGVKYIGPRDTVEEKLILLWQDILGVNRVGIRDTFFELGGHSLKATTLVSRIHKEFNVEFPLKKVFQTPTVAEMAVFIRSASKSIYSDIQTVEEREYYPMSSAQIRLYILDQFEGAGIAFNMPGVIIIDGDLDWLRFEESFQQLIGRHEILRTSFTMKDIEPIQIIHDNIDFKLTYMESNEEEIDIIINGFIKPFDLSQAPLLRVSLVKVDKHRHFLLFDMHHIISDGMSMNILIREFMSFYQRMKLPDLRIQYKDYSVWQNKHYREDTFKQQEKYWLEIFKDEIPVLNMPLDYPRPMVQSFEGNHLIFEIEGELTRKLNALAMDEGVTLYMVLLASLNILFSKYTGQDDIVIGSVSAGRPHSELENLIGLFINTLAMRNHPQEEKIFKEFLEDVKENALEAYENQDYQFDELIENLNLKRDFSRNPIFDVMFILQNMDITEMEMERLNFTYYENPLLVSKVDMLLNAMERGDGIIFNLEYCTKLFKKETIEKFAKHYVNILEEIVKNPYLKLKEINILTEEEKNTIFHDFNNTKAPYSRDKTIHELFEEQVERTPDNIALIYEDEQLTYSELNKKANQIAHILRDKGIKPDSIVGIMLERSPEMIIGLLAVLKAGGAYLPIDPSYPEERIMYILKDSAVKILLTQQRYESRVSFNGETLDLKNPDLFIGSQLNLENVNTSHDLSYVIYTSGSTGKPKGVMIEHYSVINKLEWMLKEYPITEDDVLIQKTPYTFDASVYELFIWSFTGARLCLLKPDGEKDPEEIINAIEKHMVTTIEFVPSMLSVFLGHIEETQCSNRLKSLKHVTTGGEALTTEQVKKFNKTLKKNNTNLINTYGPTETTIDVTYYYCNEEIPENIPIGKPISNIQLYIMDKHQKLQPITIPGELCISGDGLARGYLNNPELTNKSFMNNPFIHGERLYRTGDLARWLPDGNIEFLGRIDHQVKIRGNRIELGEIENRLLEHPQIIETVLVTKEDPQSGKYLCAYFIGEEKLSVPHLRAHLSKHLPDYMIPHYFIQLEKMPLNQNGKIDRKSLPEPDGSINTGVKYVAPRNEIEEKLVKIWQEILKVDKIGIKDDFFSLGGDSIKAIQVSSRLNSYGLKLEITEMLKNPVIEELSNHITLTTRQIDQSLVEGEVELTPIQKWFFKQSFEEKNNFNQAVILKNNREFVENAIIKALDKLVEHHDALRTVFKIEEGCVKQIIRGLEGELYAFEVINLLDMGDDYELLKKETGRIQESIDPENGPLLKLGLFKTAEGDYLSIIIHYLVVDDESWRIILEDLIIGYLQALNNEELKLSDKTDSLKRWSDELYDYANSKQMLKEVEYWTKLKECDIKSIPTDHTINEEMVEDYKTFKIELTRDQTVKLVEQVNEAYNTDINDILLTSLGLAVKEWTGADEVLIGMEGSSREAMINDIDINRTVGLFTAKYPVVLDLSSYNDISYAIKSTKETLRKIPNKGIGYGILKYLTLPENKEELDFNLKPEIIFNFMDYFGINNDIDVFKNSDFSIAEEIFPNMYTPCTIGINGMIIDEKLIVSFDYNGHKYEKSTIERITECFRKNLLNVVNHCLSVEDTEMTPSDFTIEDIELEELEYLQNKFNSIVEDE